MKKRFFLSLLFVSAFTLNSYSFCGFYVAKADTKLFNKTSQVILVRDGNKTTVTMANDFKGDVKDFAMVVPVPTVLDRKDIKIAENSLFNKLDSYSGPRLVEYYDRNPCQPPVRVLNESISLNSVAVMDIESVASRGRRAKDLGVTIEAQYKVEEYDILILSAKQSGGLKIWLTENGYKIPSEAESVLEPYIKNNMKFFVVKVDVEKLNNMSGLSNVKKYIKDIENESVQNLRPLQITYSSPKFMLPIRLGMANANGEQDMIVYALTKKGRVECTNYRTTKIPTNKHVPLFVRQKFGQFYVDLFDKAHHNENKEAIFLEYAWNISPRFTGMKCDPCVGPPPIFTDLVKAGVDWAINSNNQASGQVFFTRLHVRYSRQTHPRDLEFQVTPNKTHFQARYILTNRAGGNLTCEAGQKYCAKVVKERADELENLNDLTSWNTSDYSDYVKEYYNLLENKGLLNDIEPTEKKNDAPFVITDHIDPRRGIKLFVLFGALSLMLVFFILRKRRTEQI